VIRVDRTRFAFWGGHDPVADRISARSGSWNERHRRVAGEALAWSGAVLTLATGRAAKPKKPAKTGIWSQQKTAVPLVGRKGGRPRNPDLEKRFVPTREQREIVHMLAGYAIPQERIVKAIRNPHSRRPIGIDTLHEHFEAELEAGRAEVDTLLAHGLSKRLREANMTALIWVSKNLWGWADRVEQDGKSTVDLSLKIDPKDLPRLLEEHGLPPGLLGYDVPAIDGPQRLEHDSNDDGSDG
jgi:hypothetical protein